MLHGYGANGKTTLISLVKAAFGGYFVTLKAETLTNSSSTGESATPFLMSIKGARFVNGRAQNGREDLYLGVAPARGQRGDCGAPQPLR